MKKISCYPPIPQKQKLLVQKKKPAVADKNVFEGRDKWKVIEYFGTFGLSRIWCDEKLNNLIRQWISTSFKLSPEVKIQNTKPLVLEK